MKPQPGQPLFLQRDKNSLTVYFENPFPASSPSFAYRLEPDPIRRRIGQQHVIHLDDVPARDFVLRIEAVDTPIRSTAHIELVAQPFWQKGWFWPVVSLLMVFIIGVAIYLFYLYRLRQFIRLQRVRDRIARDLHDDMGSYLSSISILSQTASRSVVKDPAKAQATLDRIGQTARQVMDSMGDIVWSINPDHDSMKQVVSRMTDVASGLFGTDNELAKQVALQVDVADEVCQMSLSAERRRDFFLIYKEAITNVARYANASRVRVQLSREGGQLVLVIDDDGDGFDLEKPERRNPSGGNGLNNMKKRAELLGGVLLVRSAIGAGTTVALKFPV